MQKELVCRGVDQRVIAVTCMYVIAIGALVIAAALDCAVNEVTVDYVVDGQNRHFFDWQ